MKFFSSLVLLTGVGFGPTFTLAQDAVSRPVGYLVQTIRAGQTASLSVPFDADVSSQPGTVGRLTGVGANYLESAEAGWVPGALSTEGAPYIIRLNSGSQAGRMFAVSVAPNTSSRLYIENEGMDLTTLGLELGSAGVRFEILPGDTLATFFGANATSGELVVHDSAEPLTADLVQLWNGTGWEAYYFNTRWNRWARDSDFVTSPTRNHTVLRSDRGLMLTRRGTTDLKLAVMGRVLATSHRAVLGGGNNARSFLATMQPADITLSSLGLQLPGRNAGWRSASDPNQADIVSVWSGAAWFHFFHNNATDHWQRVGDPAESRDNYIVSAGSPILIQRRQPGLTADEKTIAFPAPSR
jgi:hypothetical protein